MIFTAVGLGEGNAMAVGERHGPAGACAQVEPDLPDLSMRRTTKLMRLCVARLSPTPNFQNIGWKTWYPVIFSPCNTFSVAKAGFRTECDASSWLGARRWSELAPVCRGIHTYSTYPPQAPIMVRLSCEVSRLWTRRHMRVTQLCLAPKGSSPRAMAPFAQPGRRGPVRAVSRRKAGR